MVREWNCRTARNVRQTSTNQGGLMTAFEVQLIGKLSAIQQELHDQNIAINALCEAVALLSCEARRALDQVEPAQEPKEEDEQR